MIKDYNELGRLWDSNSMEKLNELHESQAEYLKELNIPSDTWSEMNKNSQDKQLSLIMNRFQELDLSYDINKSMVFSNLFSTEIRDAYQRLEAPQDCIQIEQISDILSNCKELKFEQWQNLEFAEKVKTLNNLEAKIADIEHRNPCPISAIDLGPITISNEGVFGRMGGYSPNKKDITLNADMLRSNSPVAFRETLDTLIHEGRHAYQNFNINICEVHPRHSEVISWKETMGGGKWEYWGDCSNKLGQRLYEQQSIEIDARNFASDVLRSFLKKI